MKSASFTQVNNIKEYSTFQFLIILVSYQLFQFPSSFSHLIGLFPTEDFLIYRQNHLLFHLISLHLSLLLKLTLTSKPSLDLTHSCYYQGFGNLSFFSLNFSLYFQNQLLKCHLTRSCCHTPLQANYFIQLFNVTQPLLQFIFMSFKSYQQGKQSNFICFQSKIYLIDFPIIYFHFLIDQN